METPHNKFNNETKAPGRRIGFLDEARGLLLLGMVLYHAAYDVIYIFGVNFPLFHHPFFRFIQQAGAGLFILISGACCQFSRSNLRRGVIALGVGLCMTFFTVQFMPGQAILFGILHFMGSAMILYGLTGRWLKQIPPLPGFALMALLFALCYSVPSGGLAFGAVPLPSVLYSTGYLFPLGFVGPGFASADYFPLLPWVFAFFAGSYLGTLFQTGRMPGALYRTHVPFLALVGRYSIWIYVLHQPLVYGLLTGIFLLLG